MFCRQSLSRDPPYLHTSRSNAWGTSSLLRIPPRLCDTLNTQTRKANTTVHCNKCQFHNQRGCSTTCRLICLGMCFRSKLMICIRCCSCSCGLGFGTGALLLISCRKLVSCGLSAAKSPRRGGRGRLLTGLVGTLRPKRTPFSRLRRRGRSRAAL